ncbi:FUSC family protein [Marisediminicola sp. LYQ85]|uniref:FUSC family protein n=1 Tax=Marisediminicola sp. LYQ85 TaxID=3391062 RepID=UPI0039830A27
MRSLALFRQATRGPLLQVLKTSVAAVLAWIVASLALGEPLPIFAAIAALLVVQPSVNQSLAKGVERSIGVVLGVLLAALAGAVFGAATWVILFVIAASLLIAWALKLTPGSSNQIPISAMLVLALGSQTPGYAVERIVETIIGATLGLVVNALIVPPVRVAPARLAVERLTSALARAFDDLAGSLLRAQSRSDLDAQLERARALRDLLETARTALDDADESLALNPRAARHRESIARDRRLTERMSPLVTRVILMTRAVHDTFTPRDHSDPVLERIATELERVAHDVELVARRDGATGPRITRTGRGEPAPDGASATPGPADIPALTAPLVVTSPDPENWILIGSLMEDLRRVREEIIGAEDR